MPDGYQIWAHSNIYLLAYIALMYDIFFHFHQGEKLNIKTFIHKIVDIMS